MLQQEQHEKCQNCSRASPAMQQRRATCTLQGERGECASMSVAAPGVGLLSEVPPSLSFPVALPPAPRYITISHADVSVRVPGSESWHAACMAMLKAIATCSYHRLSAAAPQAS